MRVWKSEGKKERKERKRVAEVAIDEWRTSDA